MDSYENPNPNFTSYSEQFDVSEFKFSDFGHMLDGGHEDDRSSKSTMASAYHSSFVEESSNSRGFDPATDERSSKMACRTGTNKKKKDAVRRVAFRTKSENEFIDDGFKWRKYGKKSVKNSPNPRNYFKCSSEGCSVKKRVERDREDPSYVITTYEGVHNHESPCVVYYNQMSLMVPPGWNTQAPHFTSSS